MAKNKPNKAHQKALSKKPKTTKRKAKEKPAAGVPVASGFYALIEKWSTPLFFILLVATTSIVFKDFLSKKFVFLFSDIGSDSINIKYPRMVLYDTLSKLDSLSSGWIHYVGMGDIDPIAHKNLWQRIVAFPFQAVMWFFGLIGGLFGLSELPYSIAWTQYSQTVLTGLFGFLWLKSIKIESIIAVLGGLSIALSGYVLLGSTWYHSGLNMVFFLFAFEQYYGKKRWYFLPIAFTLFSSYQYWFATVFMMMYGLSRFFFDEEKPSIQGFGKFAGGVIGLCALGLILNAPNIQDQYKRIVLSPRGEGMFGSEKVSDASASYIEKLSDKPIFGLEEGSHYQNALLRTFDPDILGSGSNFTGWRNYLEAPSFSSSILFFMLLPLLFFVFKDRKRLAIGLLAGGWLLVVLFPYIRYAFYFFVGDYYKQALNYFIPLSIVFIGGMVMNEMLKGKVPKWYFGAGAGLVGLALLNMPFDTTATISSEIKSTMQVFVVLYGALITLLCIPKFQKLAVVGLVVLVPIELSSRGFRMMDSRESLSASFFESKRGYNDYSVEAIQFINERDSSFFRVEKNFGSSPSIHSSINDAQAQFYRGTQSYSSFNNIYYIRFLKKLGVIQEGNETSTRWAPGLRYTPLLHGAFNVKYTLMAPRFQMNPNTFQTLQSNGVPATALQPIARYLNQNGQTMVMNQSDFSVFVQSIIGQNNFNQFGQSIMNSSVVSGPDFRSSGYQQIGQVEDVLILENQSFVPLGVVYDKVITELEMEGLDDLSKQVAFYDAAVIPSDLTVEIPNLDVSQMNSNVTYDGMRNKAERLKNRSVQWTKTNDLYNDLSGSISLESPGWLFMSFPFDEGWHIEIDGQKGNVELTHFGFIGLEVASGDHQIRVYYKD